MSAWEETLQQRSLEARAAFSEGLRGWAGKVASAGPRSPKEGSKVDQRLVIAINIATRGILEELDVLGDEAVLEGDNVTNLGGGHVQRGVGPIKRRDQCGANEHVGQVVNHGGESGSRK